MDVGWVAAAGVDPIPLLRAHRHRFRLMHVKDVKASTVPNTAFKMDPADVGSGTLDWKAILPVGYDVGVRHYYVEQEPPFAGPRMDAVRADYEYLAQLDAASPKTSLRVLLPEAKPRVAYQQASTRGS
jgi:sugar phosphate isomerase/epimerase